MFDRIAEVFDVSGIIEVKAVGANGQLTELTFVLGDDPEERVEVIVTAGMGTLRVSKREMTTTELT